MPFQYRIYKTKRQVRVVNRDDFRLVSLSYLMVAATNVNFLPAILKKQFQQFFSLHRLRLPFKTILIRIHVFVKRRAIPLATFDMMKETTCFRKKGSK